ncbi:hypothetical protein ACT3TI_10405 [Psychrobacter sp. AOP22-C1-22]|uniref:hypothetical protein n=1 Tax=Psychrobacter TaxID=497 RepID=UPI001787FA26|nr:hypothetical protein [Psychrobacter sp. FME6]MBE0407292.1 hypothetical protein [Psychrobacter sp. FME6]
MLIKRVDSRVLKAIKLDDIEYFTLPNYFLGWGQFNICGFRAGHGLGTKWAPHRK